MTDASLSLGRSRRDDAPIDLPISALLRHVMALGSSGSGKTVLCKVLVEEVVRQGLPALCIDPQGDLCSLALNATDPEVLAERGVDPALAEAFAAQADVVVFTPASTAGIGLSADPVNLVTEGMGPTERTHAISRTASILTGLLGYDPESDDGTGLTAVLDHCLQDLVEQGRASEGLAALTDYLHDVPAAQQKVLSRYLDLRKIKTARQRLARLDVGARRMLFHQGAPIDIDLLLGRGAHAVEGKTRVSIIYLNSLHGQDDKDFFVATLVDQLYAWMLRNPDPDPQALFYIDEVAPFVPPVRKPAAKPGLQLLFKQARKYGVCCLMATQNPGDVDYKSMAQFGTWALGRLTTRQDLKKVEPTIKSIVPSESDRVMSELPSLGPGQFVLISPDHWPAPQELSVRWLLTPHETLDESRIKDLADERWRERFAGLVRGGDTPGRDDEASAVNTPPETAEEDEAIGSAGASDVPAHSSAEPEEAVAGVPQAASPTPLSEDADELPAQATPQTPAPATDPTPSSAWTPTNPAPATATILGSPVPPPPQGPGRQRSPAPMPVRSGMTEVAIPAVAAPAEMPSAAPPPTAAPPAASPPAQAPGPRVPVGPSAPAPVSKPPPPPVDQAPQIDPRVERRKALGPFDRALGQKKSMTLTDFASRAGVGQKKARMIIAEMTELGMARMYPEGSKKLYWAVSSGGRPDLDMPRQVTAARAVIDEPGAWAKGRALLRSRLFGVFGQDESIGGVEAVHRLVYRVDFEEKVPRPLLQRVFGETHDLRMGSVYLHPVSLDVLVYTHDKGIRFAGEVGEHASAIEDLDGAVTFEPVGPGRLGLVEDDWRTKKTPAEAKERFTQRFAATPLRVTAVFVPLWRLVLRVGSGEGFRIVALDAIAGRPIEWP